MGLRPQRFPCVPCTMALSGSLLACDGAQSRSYVSKTCGVHLETRGPACGTISPAVINSVDYTCTFLEVLGPRNSYTWETARQ